MSRPPSWKAVADALAARMALHAFCDSHRPDEAQPDACPFCKDRAAYLIWVAKSGADYRPRPTPGTPISLQDLQAGRWGQPPA